MAARRDYRAAFRLLYLMVLCSMTASPRLTFAQAFMALDIASGAWEPKVFPTGRHIPSAQAATFDFFTHPTQGPVMAIGPWRAGQWNCRLEYTTLLRFTTGMVRGVYKTENLPPLGAFVRVEYYVNGRRTQQTKTYYLPNTQEWESFAIVTRHPLPSANQIRLAFGLTTKTTGRVQFSQLEITPHTPPETFPRDPRPVTRAQGKTGGQPAAFYRLRHDHGTWWFVDPQGNDWYSMATVAPSWPMDTLESAGRLVAHRLRESGFNSVAGWSSVEHWQHLNRLLAAEQQPTFGVFFAMESDKLPATFDRLRKADGTPTAPLGSGHAFPDPFDPAWQNAYREHVQRVARLVAGQAWFVAWFADNELGMDDLHRHVYSAHCAQAFQTFLRHRYATIETLNAAWHTRFASFAELLRRRPDPEIHSGPMFQDFKTFARDIIRQYVRVTESILRAADPDHLLFSPRFSRDAVDVWLDYLPEFARFDAMALNFYSGNYTWDPGLERAGRQLLHEIYARTGKPLLISEWSVPALDSGLYNHERRLDHSWPQAVLTQEHRALQAARLAIDFANIPYVIGSHWFIWSDIDRADRQANRGLYRTTGAPWAELLTHLGAAQQRIGRRFAPPGDRAAPGNGPRR